MSQFNIDAQHGSGSRVDVVSPDVEHGGLYVLRGSLSPARRGFAAGSPFTMSMLAMLHDAGSSCADVIPKLKPLDS